ncbi:DctP family TRAP transporter solute-binding subunit [Selenihalanaerobacter shriftii]|uniref:Tripartite ATP-independent transporter solute receptor, DctP family n=1 Tax=Selenihalanaerobacter shriftii TaxID=142842 RepID=A0A1T4R1M2_9FIRM|nr:DctP family TRAP transporter solute-binding subunit [Selenihalanaerobacter shriftii]SKA09890.1 tripartite ATP-independent transporter solute receptor, DctP family [Selenihalanaerobacter shriftii]
MNKKLIVLLGIVVLLVGSIMGGCSTQEKAKETQGEVEEVQKEVTYEWKFAHEEQPGGFMDSVANEFKRILAEKSNGRIKLQVYPAGQLGNSKDLVELVRQGTIQFNFASTGHVGTLVPEAQGFLLHYLFPKNEKLVNDVLENGEAVEMLYGKFRDKGLEPLATLNSGWQIWTANKPLRSPKDFEGFKMRTMTSRLLLDDYKAYGANPTTTPYSEVYSSLQLDMIDGQVNPISCIANMKFYEVQKYLVKAHSNPFILTLISNPKFFNSLPKDIQKIVRESVSELYPYSTQWRSKFNKEMEKKIRKEKPEIKIISLTKEEKAKFRKLAKPVKETYIDMVGEDGKTFLNLLDQDIKKAKKQFN